MLRALGMQGGRTGCISAGMPKQHKCDRSLSCAMVHPQPRACRAGMKEPGVALTEVGPFQRLVPGKLFPPFVIRDE